MGTPFIGEIRLFGFGRTPQGWQACDGSLLQISEYEPLYVLLGTAYGGNGTSTFAVPDLRGRVPVHQGQGPGLSNYVLAQRAGTETVTLTDLQMPAHTHVAQATTAGDSDGTLGPVACSGERRHFLSHHHRRRHGASDVGAEHLIRRW